MIQTSAARKIFCENCNTGYRVTQNAEKYVCPKCKKVIELPTSRPVPMQGPPPKDEPQQPSILVLEKRASEVFGENLAKSAGLILPLYGAGLMLFGTLFGLFTLWNWLWWRSL